ncbi:lysozyme inhibitor LprI family protein [Nostoc sp. FACHB-152]|uniref:lysozyme inhibitor LprI family protein n=1 Tax=unclassified Nostoc TaxID=2593658 RepID=UPI001686C13D|nr:MULTISPECIES: lysozyme inhibitor LprI family protein [unclassified Nostoc]MBD2451819.1 lysozyme inhibitor LprI family protein [Nostoc sp. FACHB-152]MBD2472903.1 lysozyme inhibitor LprI family protein [Nostoc sp. FACHB-145]
MRLLLPLIVSTLTLSSFATTLTLANPPLAQKLNCNEAQTQLEINNCAHLSYQNADKKLNRAYKQLLPKLSKSRQQKLIAAQLAWIKFRDASCEFERSQYEGGSIAPTIYSTCLEAVTKQRTQQLVGYLENPN